MRIAIAGTNGLAFSICQHLTHDSEHAFLLLSRTSKPRLTAQGWRVAVVDYNNEGSLLFSLAGVDVVISMVTGPAQLSLIDAALHAGVERFIPAEFDGSLSRRLPNDPLDRGQGAAISRLQQYKSQGMAHTIFACGILYERFFPGGIRAADIGQSTGASGEGDYLVNIRSMRSRLPYDTSGSSRRPATISMTAAEDVSRFVVAALDLPQLPAELRMRGDRMNVSDVVRVAENLRRGPFERAEHNMDTLKDLLTLAKSSHDEQEAVRVHMLIATVQGRFDFDDANLNSMVNVTPVRFEDWLRRTWDGQFP